MSNDGTSSDGEPWKKTALWQRSGGGESVVRFGCVGSKMSIRNAREDV